MKRIQVADFLINVICPISAGVLVYFFSVEHPLYSVIRNYLPDILWAWSFFSSILIIWNRQIQVFWIALGFIFCITFELMQYSHVIKGVGDWLDVLAYCATGSIVLFTNSSFFIKFKYSYEPHR